MSVVVRWSGERGMQHGKARDWRTDSVDRRASCAISRGDAVSHESSPARDRRATPWPAWPSYPGRRSSASPHLLKMPGIYAVGIQCVHGLLNRGPHLEVAPRDHDPHRRGALTGRAPCLEGVGLTRQVPVRRWNVFQVRIELAGGQRGNSGVVSRKGNHMDSRLAGPLASPICALKYR